ncbi:LLM class F420-dependent oxidoreductase [soil metagenome]
MKVDAGQYATSVDEAGNAAIKAEADDYDGWWAFETQHDPFLGCAVAAERTESVEVGTAIAVAFARNPMTVALQANDCQALSGGRFSLGLGSQIKPHITRRYSMPWSKPAARMREFVLAVRAIWKCWETDGQLDFEGEFYTHNLMAPFFNPGPNPHGNPRILMAAVGPLMTEAAGEVADGVLCHAFSTERYMREATLPALERGFEKAGRTLDGFEITAPAFVVARDTEEEIAEGVATVKQQIAFYGSTPAYRPVLEMHGWGELQSELQAMTKRGEWDSMSELIDDEVLHTFAVVGTPEEAIAEVNKRYGDICTRLNLTLPPEHDRERWGGLFDRLRQK